MAKKIDMINEALADEVFSMVEIENLMEGFGYVPVEEKAGAVEQSDDDKEYLKFTNNSSQIWIEADIDVNDDIVLPVRAKVVTRQSEDPTRVEEFKSYEDLERVLNYFKDRQQYDFWLIGWLCASMGRRVGDIILLKWSDLFERCGTHGKKLRFKEEKTGKIVGARINAFAKEVINEYCTIKDIDPITVYKENIFIETTTDHKAKKKAKKNKYEQFRKALGEAVDAAGITYRIGTHSFRKYYANTLYKLHPQDADSLMIIQHILGHSDIKTTMLYIGELDNKTDKWNVDLAEYMRNKKNGTQTEISNSPVVSFKAEDFRDILSQLWDKAQNSMDKFDGINAIMGLAEKCML